MSSSDTHLLTILERILDEGLTPEEACGEFPELLPKVRERLESMRALDAHMEAVFPSRRGPVGRIQLLKRLSGKLPQIPGYVVENVVGSGGVGVVYRARHIRLNRTVAIKMLLAGGYAGPSDLERFKREAESIAALCHPNIVQVFDAGECDGHPYFAMEFMEGGTLATALAGSPQTAETAAERTQTLARAVQTAHSRGIVHRDLKPGNILITADGTLKVADFGLARNSDEAGDELPITLAGSPVGTPSYMSPEQARGEARGFCPHVDIYALGAILYEMLTGRPPFRGENSAETQRQVISEDPVPPSRLNSKTPRDLQTICLKCLRKEPQHRYATAGELADDLNRFLKGEPIHARPVGIAVRITKWIRRRPAAASLVGVLTLTLAASVAVGARLQSLEHARRTQAEIRESSARSTIEAALTLVEQLRDQGRWPEAQNILTDAQGRVSEAHSADLETRLKAAAADLHAVRELDRIRQLYAEPATTGYDYAPAARAYQALFAEFGLGADVPIEDAAAIVRASPVRRLLLIGLDNAAFASYVNNGPRAPDSYLRVARLADPDPWRDRFRSAAAWKNRLEMLALLQEVRATNAVPPTHQIVLMGVLLAGLGSNDETIRLLNQAQLREPSDFWINHELANALRRAGRSADAAQYRRASLAIRPDNFVLWTTLAMELEFTNSESAPTDAYHKSIELNPHYIPAWANLIRWHTSNRQWDLADEALQRGITANPEQEQRIRNAFAQIEWGRAYVSRGDWTNAAKAYATALDEKHTDDGEGWFEAAACRLLAGDDNGYRQAASHMLARSRMGSMRKFLTARAMVLSPMLPEHASAAATILAEEVRCPTCQAWSIVVQGAILCRSGSPTEAIPLFEEGIKKNSKPGMAVLNWLWLSIAHSKLDHPDEAKRWFQTANAWLDAQGPGMPRESDQNSLHLHNWLEAQVLRREAESLIRP